MGVTAAQVAQLRRMVAESTTATYSDPQLVASIEQYPLLDARGELPYTWDTSTEPPTRDDNDDWIPTYDLNAAAADVWEEKAAALAGDFDFSADGGSYNRSQAHAQALQMARFYRARRRPATITQVMSPKPATRAATVANLAEEDA